jgi:DNA-binding PadR family transcriptional regulator
MDRRPTPKSHLPLRPVEFQILLSLASGERHGYGILQDAEERGERIDVGTLYRGLARLVEHAWIAPAASDADDERRNNYAITPYGLKIARAEAARLAGLTRAARLGGLLPETAS